jgi:hypothetical protein
MINKFQWPLTRRLTTVWSAALILGVTGIISASALRDAATLKQVERMRADIQLIESATAKLAQR